MKHIRIGMAEVRPVARPHTCEAHSDGLHPANMEYVCRDCGHVFRFCESAHGEAALRVLLHPRLCVGSRRETRA